jgi:linoleoyl-CoA desaturase
MAVTVRYEGGGAFQADLKRRVDEYFEKTGLPRRGSPWMALKTAIILTWFAASYGLLVFFASTWWQGLGLAISLGLAMAGIGFSIQHDANHGGYSDSKKLNRVLALTLDMLGGSSYLWGWKHNIFHHTHTNVAGSDPDIAAEPLLRMSPQQQRRGFHRFQHLYVWGLYALMPLKWHLIDDFESYARGTVNGHKYTRPKGWELVALFGGKAFFFGWSFVLPAFFHPVWQVALFHLVMSWTLGLTLGLFFQVAHCVGEAEWPEPAGADGGYKLDREWAVHQVRTTVDFARDNKLLTWYLGGLNFQVVHHLFPKVCHVHYPAISRLLQESCEKFGETYRVHPSFTAALASHARWLKRMGNPEPVPELTTAEVGQG